MRQITQDSINAFMSADTMSKANMSITLNDNASEWGDGDHSVSRMYLHGNLIAIKDHNTCKLQITNAGWSTTTTKERLNGLPGVSIHQKNFEWYLNNEKWDGSLTEVTFN